MEREPSDSITNFKYCLAHELHRGTITEEEALDALDDFINYERRNEQWGLLPEDDEIGSQGGASGMLDELSPTVNSQNVLPFEHGVTGWIPEGPPYDDAA